MGNRVPCRLNEELLQGHLLAAASVEPRLPRLEARNGIAGHPELKATDV